MRAHGGIQRIEVFERFFKTLVILVVVGVDGALRVARG